MRVASKYSLRNMTYITNIVNNMLVVGIAPIISYILSTLFIFHGKMVRL
jgi:hypothetical protein